jgi:hypothetical protein
MRKRTHGERKGSVRALALLMLLALMIVTLLALSATAGFADSSSVTVTVRVARVISVSDSGAIRSNVTVWSQNGGGVVTYVSP